MTDPRAARAHDRECHQETPTTTDWNVPFDRPFYPPLPAHYRGVRLQLVHFRADPGAVATFLPAPLAPDADGRCVAMGIRVPECSAYGVFDEAVVQLAATFDGEPGWYCAHVWHNGPAGIAAGREVYGTPKVYADIEIHEEGPAMRTRAGSAGACEIEIESRAVDAIAPERLPVLAPSWRLKIIPRADGPGAAIKQLVDGARAGFDQTVSWCRHGAGEVRFGASPQRDFTRLQPLSCDGAYHMETSFSEGYAAVVHDYLKDAAP